MNARKQIAAHVARSRAFERCIAALDRVDRGRAHLLTVLTYHRVVGEGSDPRLDPGLISADPAELEAQIDYLGARRPMVALADVLAARRGDAPLPAGAVLVTVDDAYRDFAEVTWPVLRRRGVPACVFVPTAYPGEPGRAFWWDRVHAALLAGAATRASVESPAGTLELTSPAERAAAHRRMRDWIWATPDDEAMTAVDALVAELGGPELRGTVLGWDELRGLRDEGVTFAGHSRTHPRLDQLPVDRALEEVLGAFTDLERELGSAPSAFAYPAGGASDELTGALRAAGVELAFTTERGINDVRTADWLRLRRVHIGRMSNPAVINLQMLPHLAGSTRARSAISRVTGA